MFGGHCERDLFALLWASEETCHSIGGKRWSKLAAVHLPIPIYLYSAARPDLTNQPGKPQNLPKFRREFSKIEWLFWISNRTSAYAQKVAPSYYRRMVVKDSRGYFFGNGCWELRENASFSWRSFSNFAILWKIGETICGVGIAMKLPPPESTVVR